MNNVKLGSLYRGDGFSFLVEMRRRFRWFSFFGWGRLDMYWKKFFFFNFFFTRARRMSKAFKLNMNCPPVLALFISYVRVFACARVIAVHYNIV